MFDKNKFHLVKLIVILLISIFFSGCIFLPFGALYINSNPSGAHIFINGIDTGKVTPALFNNLYPGSYTIKLTLDIPPMSRIETIVINSRQTTSIDLELLPETEYRALIIGVDKYKDPGITDLRAPSFDVARMRQVFENARFGEQKRTFSKIDSLIGSQATRGNILQSIVLSFSQAGNNDISYFYFSGHGWSDGTITTILPYDAMLEDYSYDITAEELAYTLGNIPGTKVVIIDSCYSGGFIGKELLLPEDLSIENLAKFNANFLEYFSFYDSFLEKGNLASNGFKVIVSASGNQKCYESTGPHPLDGNPYGYFSATLCEGCGYNNFRFPYPADINLDRKVTLDEIYQYIYSALFYLQQDVQVYPEKSTFNFIEY